MLKYLRIGVIAVVLVVLSGGVAAADPTPVQPVTQGVVTEDGFDFRANLTDMTINSVPNMAATAFTREAFLSAKATMTIADTHVPKNTNTVTGGKLELAIQTGCQIDLSQGATVSFANDESLALDNVLDGVISNATPTLNDFVPNVQFTLKPGMTKYVKLHSEEITADDTKVIDNSGTLQVRVTVHDAYLTVDDCGGPVSARLVGVAQMKTQTSFDELNLYGDILSI